MNCPKCKEEIDELENIQTGVATYKAYLSSDRKDMDYETARDFFEYDGGDNYFACVKCGHEITKDEDEAIKILQEVDE